MKGIYVMQAIPPWCKEVRTKVEVVKWLGNRVLLRDLEIQPKLPSGTEYLIETDLGSFIPDIPEA